MRNLTLPTLIATLLVPAAPAMASSATTAASRPNQSALGRGFGRRTPSFGSRSRYRYRPYSRSYRRPRVGVGHFFGGSLKFLGLAYLFNMLFGWGAGGSPFGLFLLLALILLFATRRRRVMQRSY